MAKTWSTCCRPKEIRGKERRVIKENARASDTNAKVHALFEFPFRIVEQHLSQPHDSKNRLIPPPIKCTDGGRTPDRGTIFPFGWRTFAPAHFRARFTLARENQLTGAPATNPMFDHLMFRNHVNFRPLRETTYAEL